MGIRSGLTLILLLAVTQAGAASLFVRPTTVVIAKGESAAVVTVTNSGAAPVTAQLRLFAWNQEQNEDKLESTDVLVASPPMLQIPPGSSQTIRLVRTLATPPKGEESYRLIVDEIPDRAARDAGSGVVVQLRYSVPVFVMPKPKDKAHATVKATLSDNALLLDVTNRGDVHAQVSNVTLTYANGSTTSIGSGLIGYVLPDKQRQWKLALPKESGQHGKPTRVRAKINGKELLVAL